MRGVQREAVCETSWSAAVSRRGRPPLAMETVQRYAYVPVDLAAQIDLLLTDPMKDKPKYGAWSELVNSLLRDWLEEKKKLIRQQGGLNVTATAVSGDGEGVTGHGRSSETSNTSRQGDRGEVPATRYSVPLDPDD